MEEYSWVPWPYPQLLQTVAEVTSVLSTGPHQPPRVLPGISIGHAGGGGLLAGLSKMAFHSKLLERSL